MAIITSGGSSEREQKELIVMPCGVPSEARVVNTATPVAKAPHALRNSALNDGALDNWLTPILSWGFSCALSLTTRLLRRAALIKLDIINEVVNRTGITK